MKIRKEIILSIIGLATLALFIWGVNFLKGKDIFSKQQRFYAIYPRVDGLIESHPVSVNGVKIGQVNRIMFLPDKSGQVLVECITGNQLDIPVNSRAVLSPTGLLGGFEIVIELGDAKTFISNRDTLTGHIKTSLQDEIGMHIKPIKEQAEGVLARLDTLIGSLNGMMNQGLATRVSTGLDDLNKTLKNVESVTGNIRAHEETIANIIANLSSFSDTIAALELVKTLDKAAVSMEALSQIMSGVKEGEGTVGLLLNDSNLYKRLESSSHQLEILLEDIRQNPKKYFSVSVFGR